MNHRTEGELQAYLDAELQRDEAAVVAEHLMVCTDCRVRLGELRMAGEEFRRTIGEFDVPVDRPVPARALPWLLRREQTPTARRAGIGRRAPVSYTHLRAHET